MKKIGEGKTKVIWRVKPGIVKIVNKPIITKGDGKKKDPMQGKDKWVNNITANIFGLLNQHNIRTHFIRRAGETGFYALECDMIPDEVVIRRFATGSYLERNPEIKDGTMFDPLVTEFFYKDDELNDPIIEIVEIDPDEWYLYGAHEPISDLSFIGTIGCHFSWEEADYIERQAKRIFLVLEQALKELGVILWDLKIEFGRQRHNLGKHKQEIILADVIDPDSFRIKDKDGRQLSKQRYREGADMEEVKDIYKIVSELTNQWKI
ncbi:hypothetical protein KAW43_01850 [Candidatus Parcubacteria bacterium]|nr:hypothetical protein [Candidatus Parcubacteria bacterium]